MKNMMLGMLLGCSTLSLAAAAGVATVLVDGTRPGVDVAPTMYGLFFEDINHSADGGLYAELCRNRGFEDCRPSEGAVCNKDGWWISGAGHGMKPDESNNGLVGWTIAGTGATFTLDRNAGLNPHTPSSGKLEIAGPGGAGQEAVRQLRG